MRGPLHVLVVAVLAAGGSAPIHAQDNAAVGLTRQLWEPMIGYITTVAEELPESTYAYKPTPDVRSFGQLFGHVAGAQYMFCAAALGESGRNEDDIEKTRKTKSELVTALKASTDYCKKAYALSDKTAQGKIKLFGQERTKLFALGLNANHDAEHYGNLVTYLRMNGMVPPSSRRQ
jgi:uncharacterized damage-inducible protein DinB